ncbi:mechanosensitive ion channel family protein [Chondrinema litorale]|uniref:mechanosensitive ion channel family protein n=1 Tax=Chondrinema litorale TaxID=2994555 RepID=UPI0025427D91|nr:mechanosensitive ion channel family protein [Chondrinema litorale]UZR95917.1 mechanosensitive ion channel family protein [Chondrinema litorale]
MDIKEASEILISQLQSWYTNIVAGIPNLILAVIVVILFGVLSKKIKALTNRLVFRFSNNDSLASLSAVVAAYIIILVGMFIGLDILNLDKAVTSLLAGAGIIGLALGFAFQDLTSNFISGVFIAVQRPIRIGDVIETNGFFGQVRAINIRSTIIYNFAGQEIEIPSKDIFQQPILNYSKTGERRMQLNCGVSYGDDLQKAQDIAIAAINTLPFLQEGKPVELHYDGFGDSSINFKIWYWLDQEKAGPPHAGSEAIKAVKKAFDENNITIPFPIRTLELMDRKEILAPFMKNGN